MGVLLFYLVQVWGAKEGPYEFKPIPASCFNDIFFNCCTSLERLPELQQDPFGSYQTKLKLNLECHNCFKLGDNIQVSVPNIMLGIFQEKNGTVPDAIDMIIPGSEIPKWFRHERFSNESHGY